MAKYSETMDVQTDQQFAQMGEEYHAQAEEYINRELIIPSGYAPSEISSTVSGFLLLKSISINYAKYLYCLASMKNPDDAWSIRMPEYRRLYMESVRQFSPQLLLVSAEQDAGYRNPAGTGIRLFRV